VGRAGGLPRQWGECPKVIETRKDGAYCSIPATQTALVDGAMFAPDRSAGGPRWLSTAAKRARPGEILYPPAWPPSTTTIFLELLARAGRKIVRAPAGTRRLARPP